MSKLSSKCQYFVIFSSTALTLLGMEFTRASQVAAEVLFHSSMMTSQSWWMLETLHSWGWVIVEARSFDEALHHSPSWSNSSYTVWRCVLVCFGHCPVKKTNDFPTKRKPDWMAYPCRMLWLKCWLSVPWIQSKSQTVSPAKHPHTITLPPPCFMVGTTHADIIRSPTLHLTKDRFPPV